MIDILMATQRLVGQSRLLSLAASLKETRNQAQHVPTTTKQSGKPDNFPPIIEVFEKRTTNFVHFESERSTLVWHVLFL